MCFRLLSIWYLWLSKYAKVDLFAKSRLLHLCSWGFPLEQDFACKTDNLVQCACWHIVVQNKSVPATLVKYQFCVLSKSQVEERNAIVVWATAVLVQYNSWSIIESFPVDRTLPR